LPDFPGDAPNPTLINKQVNSALTQLRAEGFTGDNIVMAGHSLGGVMA
jgi:acetyl esterase/lipase